MKGGIEVDIPARFRLDRQEWAARCGWRLQQLAGTRVRIQAEDAYLRQTPGLIRAKLVARAAEADESARYAEFARWEGQDRYRTAEVEAMGQLAFERVSEARSPIEGLGALRPAVMAAADADLPGIIEQIFRDFAAQDPGATLWAVRVDPRLGWRLGALRALFGAQETPELLDQSDDEIQGFPAAKGLMSSLIFGFDSFVQVPLLAASPWLLGWSAPRIGGVVMILFGRPVLAAQPAGQMLDLYRTPAWPAHTRQLKPEKPEVDPADIAGWFQWWVQRVDNLFGLLSDPERFPGSDGTYSARDNLAMWLSVSRLLLTVHSILHHPFDGFERTVLLFSALDLLDGLRQGGVELCEPRQASKAVAQLKAAMPAPSASVVLPRCRKAAQSLTEVEAGFFLRGGSAPDRLRFGPTAEIGIGRATSQWLHLIRNSHHGFGRIARDKGDAVALLAAHGGSIPPQLPDLALLYLLRMLANPRRLFGASQTQP